jgi:hypothetical protein
MVLAASFMGGTVSIISSRTVRDFSHRAVNPPTKYKQKQCIISGIPHRETLPCRVRYTAYDNLFIFYQKIYRTVRDFYRAVRKKWSKTIEIALAPGFQWPSSLANFAHFSQPMISSSRFQLVSEQENNGGEKFASICFMVLGMSMCIKPI